MPERGAAAFFSHTTSVAGIPSVSTFNGRKGRGRQGNDARELDARMELRELRIDIENGHGTLPPTGKEEKRYKEIIEH